MDYLLQKITTLDGEREWQEKKANFSTFFVCEITFTVLREGEHDFFSWDGQIRYIPRSHL